MKRPFLLLVTLLLLSSFSFSQTIVTLYEDDLDSYTAGDYLAVVNPTWWDTWSSAPGSAEDAMISDAQAHSSPNSALVDETGGATDLILLLGDKTSGVYEVSFWMFIPSGFAGYYNIQHYQASGIEWAVEVYFNADGTANLFADGWEIPFNYTQDAWQKQLITLSPMARRPLLIR